ncbi:YncE family protein [Marinicella pacifica]|uniref:YncE family protein n=1 Tax=Marinicella pacifica TaxID=1171543 RepID=UPI001668A9BA|nr:hypothetical protein [Marinicella pacifica]
MIKTIYIILLLLFSQWVTAKVAYLPLIEPDVFYPKETALMAMDLDSGQILDRVEIGDGTKSVFVDDTGKQLYVAIKYEKRIVRLDTSTLKIVEQWNNLPSYPDKIILSEDNKKLYFIQLNVGTGINDLYQIDLNNNQISSVINFSNSAIIKVIYSNNLKYLTLLVENHINDEFSIHTYSSNDLSLKYSSNLTNYLPIDMIDNEGENFYYGDNNQSQFISRKLSDISINWSYSYSGETAYFSPYEKDSSTLIVNGTINNYMINKQTGSGTALTSDGAQINLFGHFEHLKLDSLILINYPEIFCITGMCHLTSKLNISKVNLINNSNEVIYQSQNYLGSNPIGRFVGENFYRGTAVQQVPVLSHLGLFLLLGGFIYLVSLRNIGLKTKNE